jgi:hypothetical protein
MAISQADFYAFSQATGAPVPEDPEARARIAPQVMEWRRNQLKQPKEEGGVVDTLGKIALGAGALAAGIAGFRALRGRQAVSPVNVAVQEEAVRRVAQAKPLLRGVTQQTGASTARPPIPRPPAPTQPAAAPPRGERNLTGGGVFGYLPAVEEEFVAYRPDPKEMLTRQVADARRQAATEGLLRAAEARRGSYQPDLPGINTTLMALRSFAGVAAEEAGELVAQAESRPLSAAPAQTNLFQYVKQAAEPEGDAVDRLLTEYNQLVERQARADQRARSSVREYQMEVQGKALRIMDELRGESLVEKQQTKQGFNVDQALNALESGEDQATGRVRQQLQRNEDLDIGTIDRLEDQTNDINVAASLTPDGIPVDQAEEGGRINQLVEQGKRYLRAQEVDLNYDYSPENLRQTAQVNERIARALDLKNTAERIIREERGQLDPIDVARTRSADERARLAAQGFAGEKLEQQLLENMRANFPEGREVMAPLQEETRRIERVGMPSQIEVRENIGSVIPPRQGDPERVTKAASQQSGYEGGIRGMSRVDYGLSTRNPSTGEYEELGGGIGVYGLEPKYAAGAVRRRGEFGQSDYGDLGYEYSAAAERRPTELTGKPGLEELRTPYSRLSDEQLGELTMYGSEADKYNAQEQLKRRASVDVTRELRRLQLSNEPGAAENFLTRFKQGLV